MCMEVAQGENEESEAGAGAHRKPSGFCLSGPSTCSQERTPLEGRGVRGAQPGQGDWAGAQWASSVLEVSRAGPLSKSQGWGDGIPGSWEVGPQV